MLFVPASLCSAAPGDPPRRRLLVWVTGTLLAGILILAAWQRFSWPRYPLADADTWGYLNPALSKLTGGVFQHTNGRNFVYPAWVYLWLRLCGDFRALTIAQHTLGLAAGALLWACWRQWRAWLAPRLPAARLGGRSPGPGAGCLLFVESQRHPLRTPDPARGGVPLLCRARRVAFAALLPRVVRGPTHEARRAPGRGGVVGGRAALPAQAQLRADRAGGGRPAGGRLCVPARPTGEPAVAQAAGLADGAGGGQRAGGGGVRAARTPPWPGPTRRPPCFCPKRS